MNRQSEQWKSTSWLWLAVPILALSCQGTALADEAVTAKRFESIKDHAAALRIFLNHFPKGADLHNHLDGSIYAESFIDWAAEDGLCVDLAALALSKPPCGSKGNGVPVAEVVDNTEIVNALIDSFSIRNYERRPVSGHDQFFGSFGRFLAIRDGRIADMLHEVAVRASRQNIVYLELMHISGMIEAINASTDAEAYADLGNLQAVIDDPVLEEVVSKTLQETDAEEQRLTTLLGCDDGEAVVGCDVEIRYLSTVLRGFPRHTVAAQAVVAFKLASRDARYVGINFVMPEDTPSILRDYDWQMQLVGLLADRFPSVRPYITLHAGELALGLVPTEDLQFHVTDAVRKAGARRIGHATSVIYEPRTTELLREMAEKDVLVEVNLTSNAVILGVKGSLHPFELLRENGVPVALSTDDEGVARVDLTHEYQRAVETYNLSYFDLKTLSRNSLAYSFLPGQGVFKDTQSWVIVKECQKDLTRAGELSESCRAFLQENDRASAQWELERRFGEFEAHRSW